MKQTYLSLLQNVPCITGSITTKTVFKSIAMKTPHGAQKLNEKINKSIAEKEKSIVEKAGMFLMLFSFLFRFRDKY